MLKLSVNETKWNSLLAGTGALILYISIWIFDCGPEKLPGLSRNGPQAPPVVQKLDSSIYGQGNQLRYPVDSDFSVNVILFTFWKTGAWLAQSSRSWVVVLVIRTVLSSHPRHPGHLGHPSHPFQFIPVIPVNLVVTVVQGPRRPF